MSEEHDSQQSELEKHIELLLGANPGADGEVPGGEDEERRKKAVVWELEQLAKKHGLELRAIGQHPNSPVQQTQQSKQIKEIADVVMPKMDERVRNGLSNRSIKLPDGTKMRHFQLRFECVERLSKALAGLIDQPKRVLDVIWLALKVGERRSDRRQETADQPKIVVTERKEKSREVVNEALLKTQPKTGTVADIIDTKSKF